MSTWKMWHCTKAHKETTNIVIVVLDWYSDGPHFDAGSIVLLKANKGQDTRPWSFTLMNDKRRRYVCVWTKKFIYFVFFLEKYWPCARVFCVFWFFLYSNACFYLHFVSCHLRKEIGLRKKNCCCSESEINFLSFRFLF